MSFLWAPRKEPAEAGSSRLLPGQERSRLLAGKEAGFLARKEPALAGFGRLLPVAPNGNREPAKPAKAGFFLAKAGSFLAKSRLFRPKKEPAFAGFGRLPSVAPKEPA